MMCQITSVLAFLASLIFLLMGSAACHGNPDRLPPDGILEECRLNTGSPLTILAIILWLASSVFTGLICHSLYSKRSPPTVQTNTVS
jgi:hypothetical protein